MQYQKSWGFSTKSSSNFLSPPNKTSNNKTFKIQKVQQRQAVFLREKNRQLQDLVLRMGEQLMKVSKDKQELLSLNTKYIDTVNKQFKQNHLLFDQMKIHQNLPSNCTTCKCKILLEFESDYRNLVKHCNNLEQQIKSKNGDIKELYQLRKELLKSNHTSITDLVDELVDTTHELVSLKKALNKQQFDLQKCNQKFQKMQRVNKQQSKNGSNLLLELQSYRSLINTIRNDSIDKQNYYKSKIYSLELVIEKLQKDSRQVQKKSEVVNNRNMILQSEQIELLRHNIQSKITNNMRSKSMQRTNKR